MDPTKKDTLSGENSMEEVVDVEHVEKGVRLQELNGLYNPHVDVSGVDERRLMHKVDMRTIPWLSFLIGNAKVLQWICVKD
ncbi:hypothetical protein ID866_3058 [Astraeus odoratus]|nr:hypothetical protein ID866_3058 [Astraeus odoratus]